MATGRPAPIFDLQHAQSGGICALDLSDCVSHVKAIPTMNTAYIFHFISIDKWIANLLNEDFIHWRKVSVELN